MTRRTGAAGASGTTGIAGSAASTGGGATDVGVAAAGVGDTAETGGRATITPAGGGVLLAIAGRSPAGRTTTPAGGFAPSAGRGVGCVTFGAWRAWGIILRGASPAPVAVSVRGCASVRLGMTGRALGVLAGNAGLDDAGGACGAGEAARCGAATGAAATGTRIIGAWRGCGTMRRPVIGVEGTSGVGVGAGVDAPAGAGVPVEAGAVTATGGAAITTGLLVTVGDTATTGRTGDDAIATAGRDAAACSACFRSRMAFITSPGLVAFDRSTFWRASAAAAMDLCVGLPPVR